MVVVVGGPSHPLTLFKASPFTASHTAPALPLRGGGWGVGGAANIRRMTLAFVAKKKGDKFLFCFFFPRIFSKFFPKGSEVCLCHQPKPNFTQSA